MGIGSGTVHTSTMPDTRNWGCRWALGWWKVPVSGSSNNALQGAGCDGGRTVSTILCLCGLPGATDALRPCSAWPCPRTRNYALRILYLGGVPVGARQG